MTQGETVRQLAADRNLRLLKHPQGSRRVAYYKVKNREGEVVLWPAGRRRSSPSARTRRSTSPSPTRRADKAWREAGLERITPHECRHTFASLMIAAGVNAKALQALMGHSNITPTLDTYGHLMPGSEGEAAELLDAYLTAQRERAEDAARAAGAAATGAPTGAPVAHDT